MSDAARNIDSFNLEFRTRIQEGAEGPERCGDRIHFHQTHASNGDDNFPHAARILSG
jgi:hypothetical protein